MKLAKIVEELSLVLEGEFELPPGTPRTAAALEKTPGAPAARAQERLQMGKKGRGRWKASLFARAKETAKRLGVPFHPEKVIEFLRSHDRLKTPHD